MDEDEKDKDKKDEEEKFNRYMEVPENFVEDVKDTEQRTIKELGKIVNQLDTENGIILLNEKNLSLINSLDQALKDAIFSEDYVLALKTFIGEFKVQADITNKYFSSIIDFKPTSLYQTALHNSQRNALELLGEDAFTQTLIIPLKESLQAAATNGLTFTETLDNLRVIIQGTDGEGGVMSHVKRIAKDSFSASDRGYTNTIAQDLGLEFYRISGGKIDTTRCFCNERYGKYFHRKEIEAWGEGKNLGVCDTGNGKWAGRNKSTNKSTIFIFFGGYNCDHSPLPVSEFSVPKEVIERNIKNGNFKG
jgi:hypothetical protein